jgi:hypothetical protein
MKKSSLPLLLTGLFILLLFAGRLAAQSNQGNVHQGKRPAALLDVPAHFWLTKRLTSPSQFEWMSNRSLALDSAGHPHIVYGDNSLYYAWHDGTNWHRETVDMLHPYSGRLASLALDHAGNPHVVYVQSSQPDGAYLWYAYRTGNHWTYIKLAQGLPYSASPTIVLDSMGYPHIAFATGTQTNYDLHYTYQTDTGWFDQTVGESDYFMGAISLALDETNNPHISYMAGITIKYARWADGSWQIETVDTGNAFSTNVITSIALDSESRPFIAYQARIGIRLASRTTGVWIVTALNNDVYGEWLSLALDANDAPHLSYYDSFLDGQMYATRPADTWLITAVDTEFDAGLYTSLALDKQGHPHISYVHYLHFGLKSHLRYARLSGTKWIVETVDEGARHAQPKLVIDGADRLHILYQDLTTQQWLYTYQQEPGWTTETTPISTYPFAITISFLVDADGNPHLSYYDADYLHYTFRADNQWIQHTFAESSGWGVTSLALDESNNPHIAFANYSGELRYAQLINNEWITQTIDNSGEFPFVSLQLDSLDQPHVVYPALDNDQLKYAHWQAGQWFIETLDEDPISAASLALDSQDHPHIAYWNELKSMEYVYWNGNNWLYETVAQDVACPASSWTYLALDSNDQPHIVFRTVGDSYSFLKYAYQTDNGWVIHNVGNRWFVQNIIFPNHISLVLDNQDNPFILDRDVVNSHILLFQLAADITYSPLIFKP